VARGERVARGKTVKSAVPSVKYTYEDFLNFPDDERHEVVESQDALTTPRLPEFSTTLASPR